MAKSIMEQAIDTGVGLFVIAIIVPAALVQLAGAVLTGVDPLVVTVLTILLPALAVLGLAMWFIPHRK
jgi:type IV secretory pathway TrbL component